MNNHGTSGTDVQAIGRGLAVLGAVWLGMAWRG
jgi:hypothetical protein